MFPINEYKINRILGDYFERLSNAGSDIDQAFEFLFDALDVNKEQRQAFRDTIKNKKIRYATSFNNLSVVTPIIVSVMDQEVNLESANAVGYKLDNDTVPVVKENGIDLEESDAYGSVMTGVYSISVLSNNLVLSRLIGIFVRFILFHYNASHDDWASMDLNMDRFSPDADYFPPDSFHIHIIARFEYLESWDQIYNTIHGIFFTACGAETDKYVTKPIKAELNLTSEASIDENQS